MQRRIFGGEGDGLWKDYFLLGKIYFNNKNIDEAMRYLGRARELVKVNELREFEMFSELTLLIVKGYFEARRYQEAYTSVRELYGLIRNEKDEASLGYVIETVNWMRKSLEVIQDSASYYQFL